ncbi:MAG: DUF1552 domain-containing protein [Polyangiaceae bacterium]|nr:DUF1552 domain-containing protein [Polyangiaceae bacterium]
MSKFVLNRRALLRGAVGSTVVGLGLPLLDAMLNSHGTALAGGAEIPVRFMSWFFGNGVRLDRWVPSSALAGNNPDGDNPQFETGTWEGDAWSLTPELEPLANVKDYISVLTGLYNRAGSQNRRGHHDGVAGCLSGIPFIALDAGNANYASKFGGPSLDQVIVSRLEAQGIQTYLPSLHVGVSKRITDVEGPTLWHISHKGPDEPIASVLSPQDVYDQLFGNFVPKDDPSGKLRVAMLDAVANDAKRLKTRVGARDRERLDAHLDSLSQLRQQIEALPPVCEKPDGPTQTNDDVDGNEPLEEVARTMADLVAYAYSCDLTRVVTWQQSGSVGGTVYWMTGATTEEHGLSHEPGGQELIDGAVTFNMKCFGYLLEKLAATPEGDSNLLERSAIMVVSDCAQGITHSSFDVPFIVAGRGGGKLKSNLHHRSSNDRNQAANTSDVLLDILQLFDPAATEVGAAEGYSNTPLSVIKA